MLWGSLDADFVWILNKRNLFKYGYGMLNAHIASEIIFLNRTFLFYIAKNNEKRKEKKMQHIPGVDRGILER